MSGKSTPASLACISSDFLIRNVMPRSSKMNSMLSQTLLPSTSSRAVAATTVCGAHPLHVLAICVVGDVVSVDALHVLSQHVFAPLAGNATTLFMNLRLMHHHQERHVRAWQRLVWDRHVRPNDILQRHPSELLPQQSFEQRELSGRAWCAAQVHAAEVRDGIAFDSILYLPANKLWLTPMWPYCLHTTTTRDRYHGLTLWATRKSLNALFVQPTIESVVRLQRSNTSSDLGVVASEQEFASAVINFASRHGAAPVADSTLAAGVTIHPVGIGAQSITDSPSTSSNPSTVIGSTPSPAAWRPACDAWALAAPTHLVPQPRVAYRILPCPSATTDSYLSESHDENLEVSLEGSVAREAPQAVLASSVVCRTNRAAIAGEAGERRKGPLAPNAQPSLALLIGGLARTFAHPIVHRTLRGHLLESLGMEVAVFAHLRLEDQRGMTAFGRTDLSGSISPGRLEVKATLACLPLDYLWIASDCI